MWGNERGGCWEVKSKGESKHRKQTLESGRDAKGGPTKEKLGKESQSAKCLGHTKKKKPAKSDMIGLRGNRVRVN